MSRESTKNLRGGLISWAVLRRGLRTDGAWANPIVSYRNIFKPREGKYRLYPFVTAEWNVEPRKKGTSGVIRVDFSSLYTFLYVFLSLYFFFCNG